MKSSAPILIIDKIGLIGEPLALKLAKEFPIVLVSKRFLADYANKNRQIIYTPFVKKFPVIPDNKYSHIIVASDDKLTPNFLPKVIQKARSINADFIFTLQYSSHNKQQVHQALKLYSSSKIALYGDIVESNKFIYQAQRFGKIKIPGNGLKYLHPVLISDVVDGLINLVFGWNSAYSLFYIFSKHPTTELSLAHMIQKANPEVKIDFVKAIDREKTIVFPTGGEYLLKDNYPLAAKIRKINFKTNMLNGDGEVLPGWQKKIKKYSLLTIFMLMILALAPFIFTLLFSFAGMNMSYFAQAEINRGNLNNARNSFHLANNFFYLSKKTAKVLVFQGRIIRKENNLKEFLAQIDLGCKTSAGLMRALDAAHYFAQVLGGKTANPQEDFTKGESNLTSAIIALERMKAEGQLPAALLTEIKGLAPLGKLLSNASGIMASIFGLDGEKTYLILLQDNQNLRPGGGLINSYGILQLKRGKITKFSIHDISGADKQLRGHVEPPFALRRYLPSAHWYMRDSNFDVDFVKSAQSAANFLFIETGQKVAGVIAVDASFLKNILRATGPVYVADYQETVSENSFSELMQKKDFLESFYKAIQAKFKTQQIPYWSFLRVVSESLSQKHLLFAFADNLQDIFSVNGWSSSLLDGRKDSGGSINDFIGINEANLGTNKASQFLYRNASQKVTIDKYGDISSEVVINYSNTGTALSGGDYKNYLRFILPLDSEIAKISINNISQSIIKAITDPKVYAAKNFKEPKGLEVEKTVQDSKTIYGFLVNIPVGEIVKVKINYKLADKIVPELKIFSYNLRLFKQPGIDSFPYSFSLTYPTEWHMISTPDDVKSENGKAVFSKKIINDEDISISFAKK